MSHSVVHGASYGLRYPSRVPGSTLIAAEKTGRQARCIEFEPKYCDVIVRRWQAYTGKAATFEGIDLTFEDFEGARVSSPARWAARPLPPAGPAQELPQ